MIALVLVTGVTHSQLAEKSDVISTRGLAWAT